MCEMTGTVKRRMVVNLNLKERLKRRLPAAPALVRINSSKLTPPDRDTAQDIVHLPRRYLSSKHRT